MFRLNFMHLTPNISSHHELILRDKNRVLYFAFVRHFITFSKLRKKLTVNKKRPVNLDLGSLKFPPMAIASILHRISGLVLFLLLPIMLFIFGQSLQSEASFAQMKIVLTHPCYKLVLWAFGTALIYHVLAGIRHMIMDLGFGEHLSAGRRTAVLVIVLAVILTIFLGFWIW